MVMVREIFEYFSLLQDTQKQPLPRTLETNTQFLLHFHYDLTWEIFDDARRSVKQFHDQTIQYFPWRLRSTRLWCLKHVECH